MTQALAPTNSAACSAAASALLARDIADGRRGRAVRFDAALRLLELLAIDQKRHLRCPQAMEPGDHMTDERRVGHALQMRDAANAAGIRPAHDDTLEAHRGPPAPLLGRGALRPNMRLRSSSRAKRL